MSKNNLLIKAGNNYKVAKWAEKEGLYDASVSRYYYCLYEKAIHIAKQKSFYDNYSDGDGSHNEFIIRFHKNISHLLNDKEIVFLAEFANLRKLRNKSDYSKQLITKNNFSLFKYSFNQIDKIMDKLIV